MALVRLAPETPPARSRVPGDPASALTNVAAVAFLVAMALFFVAKEPEHPALEPGSGDGASGAP